VFRYFIRRVFLAVPVLLGVATLVFSLIHLVPGDPAQAMLGDGAAPQDVDELRKSLGLDQPLLTQYVSFLRHALTGDLGVSFRTGQPVTTMILERVPATAELAIAAMFVAIVIAIPLGVVAAVWRGTAVDYAAMTFALAGVSIHRLRRRAGLAASIRARLTREPRAAGVFAGARPGGDPRAHDARQPAR
jgi:peptide/nickel transport system permease protein